MGSAPKPAVMEPPASGHLSGSIWPNDRPAPNLGPALEAALAINTLVAVGGGPNRMRRLA